MQILLCISDKVLLDQFVYRLKKTEHRVYLRSSYEDDLLKKEFNVGIIEHDPPDFDPALSCVWITDMQSIKHKTIRKPFSVADLILTLESDANSKILSNSVGLWISESRREVTIDGLAIHLTNKEFEVIRLLYNSKGTIVSRSDMLENIWGMNNMSGPRAIDVTVTRLRAKLGSYGSFVSSAHGAGYCWRED